LKYCVSLKENRRFRFLYHKGNCLTSDYLVLYLKETHQAQNRLGLTVSKKVGNAVTRNRIRRLLRENYRLRENAIKIGYDLVFVARTRAAKADYHVLGHAMEQLLTRAELLK
jgi:ribonuclease P protein component